MNIKPKERNSKCDVILNAVAVGRCPKCNEEGICVGLIVDVNRYKHHFECEFCGITWNRYCVTIGVQYENEYYLRDISNGDAVKVSGKDFFTSVDEMVLP